MIWCKYYQFIFNKLHIVFSTVKTNPNFEVNALFTSFFCHRRRKEKYKYIFCVESIKFEINEDPLPVYFPLLDLDYFPHQYARLRCSGCAAVFHCDYMVLKVNQPWAEAARPASLVYWMNSMMKVWESFTN